MFDFCKVGNDPALSGYINSNLFDPWTSSPFAGYVYLGSKKMGSYGERYISTALINLGFDVIKPLNTDHDRQVRKTPSESFIKTEFKFSLAQRDCVKSTVKPNVFSINHMALHKDWERMIFCGINPQNTNSHLIFITKEDFIAEMNLTDPVFKPQQSGKKGKNDDYIVQGLQGIKQFLDRPYIKQLAAW